MSQKLIFGEQLKAFIGVKTSSDVDEGRMKLKLCRVGEKTRQRKRQKMTKIDKDSYRRQIAKKPDSVNETETLFYRNKKPTE